MRKGLDQAQGNHNDPAHNTRGNHKREPRGFLLDPTRHKDQSRVEEDQDRPDPEALCVRGKRKDLPAPFPHRPPGDPDPNDGYSYSQPKDGLLGNPLPLCQAKDPRRCAQEPREDHPGSLGKGGQGRDGRLPPL